MSELRIVTVLFASVLGAGCGASSSSSGGSNDAGAGNGASAGVGPGGGAGTLASGGSGANGGRGGSSGAAGTVTGGAGTGGAGTGGAAGSDAGESGDPASGGMSDSGGSSSGETASGSGGDGGAGEAGSAGETAIQCTGATRYFPEFDRTCETPADCVAVAHQTDCCGTQLVIGISQSEQAAFDAAEAICSRQYPPCGCAAQGTAVEDGTLIDFDWRSQVELTCEAGSCRAKYTGTSFACGALRCIEQQLCAQRSGGPAGSPTTYSCDPTACADCSCASMTGCTCDDTGGQLTLTCQYP
jgi:hypothetical protein